MLGGEGVGRGNRVADGASGGGAAGLMVDAKGHEGLPEGAEGLERVASKGGECRGSVSARVSRKRRRRGLRRGERKKANEEEEENDEEEEERISDDFLEKLRGD